MKEEQGENKELKGSERNGRKGKESTVMPPVNGSNVVGFCPKNSADDMLHSEI